ncbi:RHS repeat-associated core domain-containing protein [Citrobacter amalonaticus]|uniref:RHS repeat-associated core domain-containing protein n=1 Tax=Citrobacter amalonaticus TaxID=35703 RepID=UPI00300DABED
MYNADGEAIWQHNVRHRRYGYDQNGRLISAVQPGLSTAYHYDPAGNRVEGEGRQQFDNRPAQDSQWQYEYDAWGNLIKKYNEREKHLYTYDLLHRLADYEKQTPDGAVTKAVYHYDPSGRRISKTVRHRDHTETTRYGWDGNRLVMTEKNGQKVHTLYEPGSFTPLLRIESDGGDEAYTLLADKLRQYSRIPFTAQEYADMERLEEELRSERSRGWLEFANIPVNLMAAQLDPLPVVNIRNVHLYQCDHRGMPVALINREGQVEWKAELDPWGNVLSEDNPHNIEQPLRLPGQWYDEESGLHYNRHRYYDPAKGRYITQDPIGLRGGVNLYSYVPNPLQYIDPLGLEKLNVIVNNNGIGHVGIQRGSGENAFLYDPGGSFVTTSGPSGSGNLFVGTESIVIFIYNLLVYKLHQSTDFPEITGSIWLSSIFYILYFKFFCYFYWFHCRCFFWESLFCK